MDMRRNRYDDPTLAELESEIASLKGQVARAIHAAEGQAENTRRHVRNRAYEMAEGGREQLHILGDMAGRRMHEAGRYARSNPGMTLGAAAVFGVVVGMLLTTRH